jgi:hypothetical protein
MSNKKILSKGRRGPPLHRGQSAPKFFEEKSTKKKILDKPKNRDSGSSRFKENIVERSFSRAASEGFIEKKKQYSSLSSFPGKSTKNQTGADRFVRQAASGPRLFPERTQGGA